MSAIKKVAHCNQRLGSHADILTGQPIRRIEDKGNQNIAIVDVATISKPYLILTKDNVRIIQTACKLIRYTIKLQKMIF